MRNHPVAWLVWVCCAVVCALLTRNPLYLAILGLCAWLVLAGAGQDSGLLQGWRGLIRLGALIWVVTIPFNALLLHEGQIVLFRLPITWPLVGGDITLEAVLYGASAGLAIWILITLFTAFNTAVDASIFIRLAPPVLYQASIITSIGLTFVPQLVKSSIEIREAQRVRGHRFRSWRDLVPLVMPLLTTSLERAMMLAESMEARGFGGEVTGITSRRRLTLSLLIVLGLGLLLSGLLLGLLWRTNSWWVSGMIVLAVACLGYAFYALSQHSRRSHYRRLHWQLSDSVMCAASAAATVAMLVVRLTNNLALTYYPFPPTPLLPQFNPWLGLALALFAIAGLTQLSREATDSGVPDTREVTQ